VDDCLQFIMPIIKKVTSNIFAFMPEETVVVFDECKLLADNLEMLKKEHSERVATFLKSGEAYDFTEGQLSNDAHLLKLLNEKRRLAVQSLTTSINFFSPLKTFTFRCTPVPKYNMRVGDAVTDIANWQRGGYSVIVCCASEDRANKLYSELYEKGLINKSFSGGYEDYPGCGFLVAGGESSDPDAVRDAVLAAAARMAEEGIDAGLWNRLKKAAYGSRVRSLNSFENICVELAQAHFAGQDYFGFPEVYDKIEKTDVEEIIRHWVTEERTALSIIKPGEEEA